MGKDDGNVTANSNTANSKSDSVASDSSSTDRSRYVCCFCCAFTLHYAISMGLISVFCISTALIPEQLWFNSRVGRGSHAFKIIVVFTAKFFSS